ncbi:hypothetical protein C2E23DRAFT_534525 [Lenzites betulinus]|nr:hypothetical protein C2E23DRAFT_534525 [Lenzites betulinus]
MDQATMYDTPAALKTQIKHYKTHSERQAAKIAGLEGKVVDLEAKIAFLQETLVNERQKSNTHFPSFDVHLSLLGPSTSTASFTDSKFQVSQPADAVSRFKASGAEKAARPFTPVSLPSGSVDDPVWLDDEDDEVLHGHYATLNSSPHEKPKPLDKRKASSSGNLNDLIPTWPALDSPRKKPKVWVEVPRLHTTRSSRALLSKPVHKSPAIEASQKEPRAVPRGITPESVPSTMTPERAIWGFEDGSVRAPSPALTPSRSPSRELTYVEIPKTISQAVSLPRADQSDAESSMSQALDASSAGSARQPVLTHLSGPSHTAVEEQGGQVVEAHSTRQSGTHSVHRPSPSPTSTTASSNRTESSPGRHPSNLRARLDTLATYQIPLISHKSLSLRISRQELGALDQDNHPNSLPARLCASRKADFFPRSDLIGGDRVVRFSIALVLALVSLVHLSGLHLPLWVVEDVLRLRGQRVRLQQRAQR